jgi:hypothetical protein
VGSISTYPNYITTTPMYTLTSMTYITDNYTNAKPYIPTATASSILPQASGTWSNCSLYRNFITIPAYQDQTFQKDIQFISPFSNNCDYTAQSYSIKFSDFIHWNPSLKNDTYNCVLNAGFSYCVYVNGTPLYDDHISSNCLAISNPPPETVVGCTCFTEFHGYDVDCTYCSLSE